MAVVGVGRVGAIQVEGTEGQVLRGAEVTPFGVLVFCASRAGRYNLVVGGHVDCLRRSPSVPLKLDV